MQQQLTKEELRTLRTLQTKDIPKRQRGIKWLVQKRAEVRHLRDVAAYLALKPRRSLRIQWQQANAQSIQERGGAWYTLILFGEDDYWANGGPSLEGHNIVVYPSRLPTPTISTT